MVQNGVPIFVETYIDKKATEDCDCCAVPRLGAGAGPRSRPRRARSELLHHPSSGSTASVGRSSSRARSSSSEGLPGASPPLAPLSPRPRASRATPASTCRRQARRFARARRRPGEARSANLAAPPHVERVESEVGGHSDKDNVRSQPRVAGAEEGDGVAPPKHRPRHAKAPPAWRRLCGRNDSSGRSVTRHAPDDEEGGGKAHVSAAEGACVG